MIIKVKVIITFAEYFILLLYTKTGRHDRAFVWLPPGVTLIGGNTFVVGSVADWLGIRLVIWRPGFNFQLSHIFTSPRTADVFPVVERSDDRKYVCGSQATSSLIFLSCVYFCSQLTANVFGNRSALVTIVIHD